MVGVSLRQKPASATDQNAHISHRPVTRHAAVRPVSGTPVWARSDHAPGAPRPASPWDTWTIPPKPAALNHTRKPSPRPTERAVPITTSTTATTNTTTAEPTTVPTVPATAERTEPAGGPGGTAGTATTGPVGPADPTATIEPSPPFRPWRIDFAHPKLVEYPTHPEYPVGTEQPESTTVARRLLLLLGLAYLFLAALASGLAYTGYFATTADPVAPPGPDDPEEPMEGTLPPPHPPRPPARHPNAPGLHTRPDGTRYLVMPLPADIADRFRGRASAISASATRVSAVGTSAMSAPAVGGPAIGARGIGSPAFATPAMGGGAL